MEEAMVEPFDYDKVKEYTKVKDFDKVICEKRGGIGRITLDNDEKMNTWTMRGGMTDDFHAALDVLAEDDDIRCVIIKGAGRAFSAGHDLSEVGYVYKDAGAPTGLGNGTAKARRPSQRVRLHTDRLFVADHMRHVLLYPKVTIAQVHGYCLGEGLMIAANCELIIATEDCKLGHTEERLGGAGLCLDPKLILSVGLMRALDLTITGRMIDGKEAAEIGLVTRAVPADKLEGYVETLAEGIANYPRDGIALGKMARNLVYDLMGITGYFAIPYVTHTLLTNMRYEPDEQVFFKARRDEGVKEAAHMKDAWFKKLDQV